MTQIIEGLEESFFFFSEEEEVEAVQTRETEFSIQDFLNK